MPVVTMSGNLGSGAREVGQAAGQALGIDFVDQQLLVEAARRANVPLKCVVERDERSAGLRERLSGVLQNFLERSAVSGADPLTGAVGLEALLSRTYAELAAEREEPQLSDTVYIKTMTAIIEELAGRGNIVILGRGSQMILRGLPGALHVLCVAPPALCSQRLAERENIGLDEASRRVADSGRARVGFHRKFWKAEVDSPALYDLVINTERVLFETAAELVAAAVRAKEAAAQG